MADLSISQIIQESLMEEQPVQEGLISRTLNRVNSGRQLTNQFDSDEMKDTPLSVRLGYHGQNAVNTVKHNATLAKNHIAKNKWKYGAGAAAAGAAGGAYLWHRHKQNSGVKGAVKKYGKAAAATSLAAIGAGVGAKALLKYLRKKKKQG